MRLDDRIAFIPNELIPADTWWRLCWPTPANRETGAGAVIITMRRDNSGRRRFGRVVDFGARPYRRGPNFRVVPVVFDGGPGGGFGGGA